MRASEWLLLGTCALSLYGMGQVWLVQQSSYRLGLRRHGFRAYASAGGSISRSIPTGSCRHCSALGADPGPRPRARSAAATSRAIEAGRLRGRVV